MASQEYGTPEYREYRQANRYGMTVSQLRKMYDKQNGKCLICNKHLGVKFSIDHDPDCCDHSAKRNTCGKCTRGLLCQRCNLYVGHIEGALYDNMLDRILRYIEGDYDPNKPLKH